MLVEITERAMAHCNSPAVLIVGGRGMQSQTAGDGRGLSNTLTFEQYCLASQYGCQHKGCISGSFCFTHLPRGP